MCRCGREEFVLESSIESRSCRRMINMSELRDGLAAAAEEIAAYREMLPESSVGASATRAELVAAFLGRYPPRGLLSTKC